MYQTLKIPFNNSYVSCYYLESLKNNINAPLVIYLRGGSKNFSAWEPDRLNSVFKSFVGTGLNVISLDYPGSEASPGIDEYGGSETDFIESLPNKLKGLGFNFGKVGLFGASRGGLNSYQILKDVKWVSACVIKAGLSDMRRQFVLRPDMKEWCKECFDVENPEELYKRSPVLWIKEINKCPLLLIHGYKDRNVSINDSLEVAQELKTLNYPLSLELYEDGDHLLKDKPVGDLMLSFFKKYLLS